MKQQVTAIGVAIVTVLSCPGLAAQSPEIVPALMPAVGQEVRITEASGPIREGILRAVTTESVRAEGAGGREFSVATGSVKLVERRGDSLKNGIVTGALIGLGMSVLSLQGYDSGGKAAAGIGAGMAISMLVGARIDAGKVGWTRVYPPTSATRQ